MPSGSTSKTRSPRQDRQVWSDTYGQPRGESSSAASASASATHYQSWRPRDDARREDSSAAGDKPSEGSACPHLMSVDEMSKLDKDSLKKIADRATKLAAKGSGQLLCLNACLSPRSLQYPPTGTRGCPCGQISPRILLIVLFCILGVTTDHADEDVPKDFAWRVPTDGVCLEVPTDYGCRNVREDD